jgi:hypothetical protein
LKTLELSLSGVDIQISVVAAEKDIHITRPVFGIPISFIHEAGVHPTIKNPSKFIAKCKINSTDFLSVIGTSSFSLVQNWLNLYHNSNPESDYLPIHQHMGELNGHSLSKCYFFNWLFGSKFLSLTETEFRKVSSRYCEDLPWHDFNLHFVNLNSGKSLWVWLGKEYGNNFVSRKDMRKLASKHLWKPSEGLQFANDMKAFMNTYPSIFGKVLP